ncbi:unnamed protein product, partial [Schistosoma margrebowiei]
KPSDALLCLLTQAIISNACKLSGVIYQDNEKSKEIHVFLQPLYQAYKFLVRIKRKDFNLLNRKLTVKDVLEAVCKCNPVVGTIEEYNSDAELTFFDFFEALIHCTLTLMLEKDEPQVETVDNKIKTIKSDLTIKLNRRLSRRPSTSRQLKSNTGKKQKEKKSKTKRGAENRKISISPEIDKSENQKEMPDGFIDQEEQLLQQNPELDKTSSSIQCEVETWESCMRNFLNKFLQSVEELQILHNRVYQLN